MNQVFQIHEKDNVVTALEEINNNCVEVGGNSTASTLQVVEKIPMGHKIALVNIGSGSEIIKYGVVIGVATKEIQKGSWVHLHCMKSCYDERSSHLDVVTGAPKDINYD